MATTMADFLRMLSEPQMAQAAETPDEAAVLDNPVKLGLDDRQGMAWKALMDKPQREEAVDISAPPIEYKPIFDKVGGQIKSPEGKFAQDNYNNIINTNEMNIQDTEKQRQSVLNSLNENKMKSADIIQRLNSDGPKRISPYIDQIKKTSEEYSSMNDQKPQSSFLSDAILALGPALLGSVIGSGTTGNVAGAATAKATVPMVMKNREQAIKEIQTKRESLLKAWTNLNQAEKLDQEGFSENAKAKADQLKLAYEATKDLSGMDVKQLNELNQNLQKYNEDALKYAGEGTKQVVNAEIDNKKIEAAKINAQRMAEQAQKRLDLNRQKMEQQKTTGANLDLDKKKVVENLATRKANIMTVASQIEELNNQIKDKTIPESQRQATALEQLKLLNSIQGPDAVGASEQDRLAGYLNYKPDPFGPKGWKLGPDLDSYAKQLDRLISRQKGTITTLQKEIDKNMGRASSPTQEATSQGGMTREQKIKLLKGL